MVKQIKVNSIRAINKDHLEIIITGISELSNSSIKKIIETTFKVIKKGNCERCPMAAPINKKCVCVWQ